jgi:hypothetical protein
MAITVKAVTISFIALATLSALHRQKKSQIKRSRRSAHKRNQRTPESFDLFRSINSRKSRRIGPRNHPQNNRSSKSDVCASVSQASAVLRPALEIYYELTEFAAAARRCSNSCKSNRVSTALGRAPTYEGDERTDQEHNSGSDRETCNPRTDLLCLLLDLFPFLRRHVHRSHVFQHFLRPHVFLSLRLLPVLSQNTPIQLSISNTRFHKREKSDGRRYKLYDLGCLTIVAPRSGVGQGLFRMDDG